MSDAACERKASAGAAIVVDRNLAALVSTKLERQHLERQAIVYVRQSSPQQVQENRESTARQYALVDRALALGWRREQIEVIDEDQGVSGRSVAGRLGFQRLLAEVGLDHVGLILGLEMSRLARSCKDWHQLLELCAVFQTLLGDQDGLYDPTDFNDRLLLGLKGTMSEAELHILKGRMYQGRMNKARRGELWVHAPIGYVKSPDGSFVFDPDEQAQSVVRLVFAEFLRLGTMYRLLHHLAQHDIRLPIRPLSGPNKGQLAWHRPNRATLLNMLHHPAYAGAYRYGHRPTDPRKRIAGRRSTGRMIHRAEACEVLLRDRLPAYISWEEYEEIQQRLEQNQCRAEQQGAPRSGPSLLGGLVYCGRCGLRLMVTYSGRANRLRYQCARASQNRGQPLCQGIAGRNLDQFVAEWILEILQPASLELSLAASKEAERARARLDQQWRQRLERATQQADRAARQFQAVEPENRLVARTLEKNWEAALHELEQLRHKHAEFQRSQPFALDAAEGERIRHLAEDIPTLWASPTTTPQDRQEIVRMLIERLELNVVGNSEQAEVTITWVGGCTSRHRFRRSVQSYRQSSDIDPLVAQIVALRNAGRSLKEVAAQLNQSGLASLRGRAFTMHTISKLLVARGLYLPRARTQAPCELEEHEWWLPAIAEKLGMPRSSLMNWHDRGWIRGRKLPGLRGRLIIWADATEVDRLQRLRQARRGWSDAPYPEELTTPKSPAEL